MHQNKTNPKTKYDAISTVAGPAGCSCAHKILKEKKKVIIIDKANFQRHKPCAGGITMKALKESPINIDHIIQH